MQKLKLAFIGLGTMGYPMAGHLARAGHALQVYNRTQNKAAAWVSEYGGTACGTPALAAADADMIFACVGDDADLRAVTTGPQGAFSTLRPGTVFVDHSTTSAGVARELAADAAKRDCHFLDAPISGGQIGAQKGTLSIMAGGEAEIFERAKPIMAAYGKAIALMGAAGAGQLTKMVNQIAVVGVMQGLAEGIDFGLRAGLDMQRVLEVLTKGAATSWQMENRGGTMVEGRFDFGFAVDWMHKDLGICLEEAQNNGARLEQTARIHDYYSQLKEAGRGREDFSALIQRLRS
jgi:3-hydroxyisobutyrate dehydrogenase